MKRITNLSPRENYISILENEGMLYHTINGIPYWNETVAYEFTADEIDYIDDSATDIQNLCMSLVQSEVTKGDYLGYNFTDTEKELIQKSWYNQHKAFYGRMDFGYDGTNLKLFEYNADTPTCLLESSVCQWNWMNKIINKVDQFNSIHEKMQSFFSYYEADKIHFTAMKNSSQEDWCNLHYILDVAYSSGKSVSSLDLESVGWDTNVNSFVDMGYDEIHHLFKLYPWEWLMKDEFAPKILQSNTIFLEPAWKMILSNKMLPVKLWQMFPNHPNLLPAYEELNDWFSYGKWVKKPKLGREGQGISHMRGIIRNSMKKGDNIAQKNFKVKKFDGYTPVLGVWVVNGLVCGMGIREDKNTITSNTSSFVPHYFL